LFSPGTEHYAKTIIFVVSDHHLDGMQAFLASYHGVQQTSTLRPIALERATLTGRFHLADLVAQDLEGLQKGVIWTALCIDYPGHSFSHLGIYFGASAREMTSSVASD
jgi:glycosylphosphatidylinositol transamidase